MRAIRRIGRIILSLIITALVVVLALLVLIQIPAVQSKAASFAVEKLNEAFNTQLKVERVKINFSGDIDLHNVSAIDDKGLEFIKIEKANLSLNLWKLLRNPNNIEVKKLNIYNPEVKIITYKGEEESNFIYLIDKFSSEESSEDSKFSLKGNLNLFDGKLLIENRNLEEGEEIWIDAKNIFAEIKNFKYENKEVFGDLKSLKFLGKKYGEDYELKNFSSEVHYSKKEISLKDLDLETGDSHLNGHLTLSYDDLSDFGDFINKVNWDLSLEEKSKVGFKDIRYFVKYFDSNSIVNLQGQASGTLSDLNLTQLQLTGENNFLTTNSLRLINITTPEKMEIHSEGVKLQTSYAALKKLLPSFATESIPEMLNMFGTVDYNGNFDLDPNEITAKGDAVTAVGTADFDILLEDYLQDIKYSGNLIAENINLKQITEVEQLGFVSGHLEFDGQGTDLNSLKIRAKGHLAFLDLMEARYHNIEINGKVEKSMFDGYLAINDANLIADYNGLFDFSAEPYYLDFVSDVKFINLDYLNVTENRNAVVSGEIKGNLLFSDIDNFEGIVEIRDLDYKSNTDKIQLDVVNMVSLDNGNYKSLSLDIPGYLSGEIEGNFLMSQLPAAMFNAASSTALLNYEKREVSEGQYFNFLFEVEQNLFSIIDQSIVISPGTILEGEVDTTENTLIAELNSRQIGFQGMHAYQSLISIDTSKENQQIYAQIDSLNIKDFKLYSMNVTTTPIQDSLLIDTNFFLDKENSMKFDLNFYHTLDEEKNLVFGFSPSLINLDGVEWTLNQQNDLFDNKLTANFDENFYKIEKITLESKGNQKMVLSGHYAGENDFYLDADLRNVLLSEAIPKSILGDLALTGIANGDIDIVRTEDELKPLMQLKIDSLGFGKYQLGDLSLNGSYNAEENGFDVETYLDQGQVQVLYANGFIDNKPKTPELDMAVSMDDFSVNFIEAFLSEAMSNIRGTLSGSMNFKGSVLDPNFQGILDAKDLGFTVNYLGVDYLFEGTNSLPVSKEAGLQGSIYLEDLSFIDTRFNTKGNVDGQVMFQDITTWFLLLSFSTDNLLVMNTTIRENELFFGRLFGQGYFDLYGPPEAMDITADATMNENSQLTINTGSTIVEEENSLVRFVPNQELESIAKQGPQGMSMDLKITATPTTTVNLIFDSSTDDMVIANGYTEDMKVVMTPTGGLIINGEYVIESGTYNLRQIPLVPRDFNIGKGSTIVWTDDAYDALINITASYFKTVSNVGDYLGIGYSQSHDVQLDIILSETLSKPLIDFNLSIPKAGADVQSQLDYKFNSNPDDKMIQFGTILLLGQFNSENSGLESGVTSQAAGLALKQLGNMLSSLVSNFSLNIGYVAGDDLSGTSTRIKTDVNVDLSPRWAFKGSLGLPMEDAKYNNSMTGEAEMHWDISKKMDKSLILNFFTRPTTFGVEDITSGNNQSYGAGINYTTSFNKFSEIFEKDSDKANQKAKEEIPAEPAEASDYKEETEDEMNLQKEESDSTSINLSVQEEEEKNLAKIKSRGLVRFK